MKITVGYREAGQTTLREIETLFAKEHLSKKEKKKLRKEKERQKKITRRLKRREVKQKLADGNKKRLKEIE